MLRRIRLHHALFAAAVALAVVVSGPAAASIGVAGTGEPRFTNSQTNTVWFAWSKPREGATGPYATSYYADLAFQHGATGEAAATGATGAAGPLGPTGATGAAGEQGVAVGPEPLIEGHSYGLCATGRYALVPDPVQGDFLSESAGSCEDAVSNPAGRRYTGTIIDRTRPSIQVRVGNGGSVTRAPTIPVRVDYTDALSPPYPANFVCLRGGIDPATAKAQCDASSPASPQYAYNAHCSSPLVSSATPGANVNAFPCNIAVGTSTPDGPVTFCAIAADQAIPDNPASSNQAQSADKANLSASACGSIVLDRTAPSVAVAVPASVRIGEELAVSASGQDATSGLAGQTVWNWGDDTPNTAGTAATHVFTTPGTYTVAAAMGDVAGNVGRGMASVVVTSGPATATKVRGGSLSKSQLTAKTLLRRADAGGTAKRLAAGDLQGLVPSRVRLKAKGVSSIPMALGAGRKGVLSLSYTLAGRRLATAGLQITRAGTGTFSLRLPRRSRTGRGQLLVRWTPAGGSRTTVVIDVTLVAARRPAKARRSAAAPRRSPFVTGAPPATLPR